MSQNAGAVRLQLPAGIDRKVVRELAGLAFVERCENVILLGPRSGETPAAAPV
ncbi:hypothetical protein IU399_05055 [Salmonella enterica subsp. enterica serovar Worthington]|nr:hypothetical protein [Salmonella enterica subsp. enterica serovar Worthington]